MAPVYAIRTPNCPKRDLARRWALPDRVFFACGACHILAHAFLEQHGEKGWQAVWIKPAAGHTGNHIFATDGVRAFDYHGLCDRGRLLSHYWRRARGQHPGWDASLQTLDPDILISGPASRQIDGLWLRGPTEYFQDALPRARAFLDRFPALAAL